MKILIVNSYDIYGGAARAAYRLHKGLQQFGIDSTLVVQKKFSKDESVFVCENDWSQKAVFYEKLLLQNYPNKSKTLFSTAVISNEVLIEFINNSDADIVHLHWITNGFLSSEDIRKIRKPLVWSLHDMWAFTGGCHYDEECNRYENECGQCKVLGSSLQDDLSHKIWKIKKESFSECSNLTIVGLSNWLTNAAQQSSLLKNNHVVQLPNPINCDFFTVQKKRDCRKYFNLPQTKKLILFGAMGATSDLRKGYKELISALENLNTQEIELVVFGNTQQESQYLKYTTHFLGKIEDDLELKKLYSAVDVMVTPSLQENLSNAIMEALSCSTPVVAFNIGGNKDMIEHQENGYLANPFDINDLAYGIQWVIFNKQYVQLCENAKRKVMETFSYDIVLPKYINLYRNIIKNNKISRKENSFKPQTEILLEIIKKIENNNNQKISFSKKYNKLYEIIETLKKTKEVFVIYGYGTIGKTIHTLMPNNIVGYVDMAQKQFHPKNLLNMKYDKIIISVLGREDEIVKYLVEELNINTDKIITLEIP
ncbi:glycosyltransferase family 4 protein [Aliarcobacter cryaerophilus]|uniref:glycosyltransferase family 4 protein n=1 Tax=Aliarcobacter cryaerophilus TaxID=28198 RepID=UPI0021B61107|nr:glycosyltransferase family 4 protein [Aliarcobacter cryaerophilus]MCT7530907.1 glycosyltransferase family 4 protein [Aliarcobacter cryaerophilus]